MTTLVLFDFLLVYATLRGQRGGVVLQEVTYIAINEIKRRKNRQIHFDHAISLQACHVPLHASDFLRDVLAAHCT